MPDQTDITDLLQAYGQGDSGAFDRLFPAVYDELRRIAHRHMQRERSGHTLTTTALVHECYLNLADQTRTSWQNRAHFFAVASTAMRHLLIDYARRRTAQKRGGDRNRISLDEAMPNTLSVNQTDAAELISLDDALTALAQEHARMTRVVECRFFGEMTVKETASALDVSTRTVERDWTRAKAHLAQMLRAEETPYEKDTPESDT